MYGMKNRPSGSKISKNTKSFYIIGFLSYQERTEGEVNRPLGTSLRTCLPIYLPLA